MSKVVMIDTFYRPLLLNEVYYNYFIDVFDVPQYTCHPSPTSYIGIQTPYLCYCNGNNYQSMPSVTLLLSNNQYEYN